MTTSLGMFLILAALVVLMLAVRVLQARGTLQAEGGRKAVHLGMGTICLSFPWLFHSVVPVWWLAALSVGALAAVRVAPSLRGAWGNVLGGVGRASWGELFFPVSVALVFTLAGENRAAFCVPIAILTYADAAGALVGQRWGRHSYPAVESTKTVEGSLAVFVVTVAVVALGLVALGELEPRRAFLIGATMGVFAALVEAVSWRGLDNLLLPIVALAQVHAYGEMPILDLLGRVSVVTLLALFMLNWRQQLLDSSARLAAALALYLFWSLGDWRWLVPPALLLASYARLMPTIPGGPPRHNLAAVVCVASAGAGWAWANGWHADPAWLLLYTLGLATQQAIIAAVRFAQGRPAWRPWQWWLVASAQAVGVQALGFVAANGVSALSGRHFLFGAAAVLAALGLFISWDRRLALPDDLNARWWRQGLTAALASVAALVAANL